MGTQHTPSTPWLGLPAFDPEAGDLNVIIETPAGSRNKFKYESKVGLFRLSEVLQVGASFPFDFGYIPSTLGQDGDPLDVLLLIDAPVFSGCLVPARLVGVIEAQQTEQDGTTERNDRLVAIACKSHDHSDIREISQLNEHLLHEIESFFTSYNALLGKQFKPIGRKGATRARNLVKEGMKRHKKAAGKGKQS